MNKLPAISLVLVVVLFIAVVSGPFAKLAALDDNSSTNPSFTDAACEHAR